MSILISKFGWSVAVAFLGAAVSVIDGAVELNTILDQSFSLYSAGLGTVALALVIPKSENADTVMVATRVGPLRDAIIGLVICLVAILALGKIEARDLLPPVGPIPAGTYVAILRTAMGAIFLFFGLRLSDAFVFSPHKEPA